MDKKFHPIFYNGCNYSSDLGLKLINVNDRRPSNQDDIALAVDKFNDIFMNEIIWWIALLIRALYDFQIGIYNINCFAWEHFWC